MGFNVKFNRWATPLPIITRPEALRPTLSKGLPFHNYLYYRQKLYKTLEQSVYIFESFHIIVLHCGIMLGHFSIHVHSKLLSLPF